MTRKPYSEFSPERREKHREYQRTYQAKVRAKARGVAVEVPAPVAPEPEPESAEVIKKFRARVRELVGPARTA